MGKKLNENNENQTHKIEEKEEENEEKEDKILFLEENKDEFNLINNNK